MKWQAQSRWRGWAGRKSAGLNARDASVLPATRKRYKLLQDVWAASKLRIVNVSLDSVELELNRTYQKTVCAALRQMKEQKITRAADPRA